MNNKLLKIIGIDTSILFMITARFIQASGGVVSIILTGYFLNPTEQGYFYTFSSILALQQLFELGTTGIITQFVAHEKAFLYWTEKGVFLSGNTENKSKLSSLLKLAVEWFSYLSIILIISLCLVGYIFFSYNSHNVDINWLIPWILAVIATTLMLLLTVVLAFFEGLGRIKEISKIRMIQQIFQIFTLITIISFGGKLYAIGVSILSSATIGIIILIKQKAYYTLCDIWNSAGEHSINWKKDIFPFQIRISISWLCGYFIFQFFNPIIFAVEGASIAGQFGMTMAILNGIQTLSSTWYRTKISYFSTLIANRDFYILDKVFSSTVIQSVAVLIIGLTGFGVAYLLLQTYANPYVQKVLPILPLSILMFSTIPQLLLDALATYLRCHKQDPFFVLSILMGVLTVGSTYSTINKWGVIGITSCYAIILLVSTISGFFIFHSCKNKWHVT